MMTTSIPVKGREYKDVPREIIDTHVHAFPDRLFEAIWDYFEKHYWPIKYKLKARGVNEFLERQGVLQFSLLNYAHKPGISRDMNTWTKEFCNQFNHIIPFGTIHPDDPYFEEELERVLSSEELNLKGLKLQLLVTDFDPDIPKLDAMYEKLVKYEKILVLHCGTGPGANCHVGISKIRPILERFPTLKLQIPHLGCFEYKAFFDLVQDFPHVYFDTAMILVSHGLFNDGFDETMTLDSLFDIKDRIMFGSDFPNIPYEYNNALDSILNLPISYAFKERILKKNAEIFYNLV